MYRQLLVNSELESTWDLFLENLQKGGIIYLIACISLMPLNWLIESQKWKILVTPFESISLRKAIKGVLSGISFALLTPNRIGEYGGRMVMVEARNNWKAVISTVISSYSQNIWNIGVGLICSFLFLQITEGISKYYFYSGFTLSILFVILIIILYFNIEVVNKLLFRWNDNKWISKALKHLTLLSSYKTVLLATVLLWAFIRYLIYFLQYFLMLKFFGLEFELTYIALGIGTIFLIQTALPLPPIVGFFARGEIALMIWGMASFNDLSVLASSYSLWLLNLLCPSIAGSIIILSSNLWRSLGLGNLIFRKK